MPFRRCRGSLAAVLTVVAAIEVCSIGRLAADPFFREGVPAFVASADARADAPSGAAVCFPRFEELTKGLSPSVVNISVESDAIDEEAVQSQRKDPNSPLRSVGSGFLISDDGYVVTSNHVIDRATRIVLRLLDDTREYEATVVGKDQKTDLALLKIEAAHKLTPVFVGDSDTIEVGAWVLAIGNQFQLGQTVTAGIVSAKGRKVPASQAGPYDSFIQTDASINPGSSGGPLFNTAGQVIGINTAIYSPGRNQFGGAGFNIGIGFAIPINLAKGVITQLKDKGKVTRGLLGVMIQRIDEDTARALKLDEPRGALVSDIMDGSPARRGGFAVRDVIVKFDGRAVRDYDDLPIIVANTPIGKSVSVEVLRAGRPTFLNVTIDELKEARAEKTPGPQERKPDRVGLVVDPVSPELSVEFKQPERRGAVVVQVGPGSAAERAGVQPGDIIEEVAERAVTTADLYAEIVQALPAGQPVLMLVRRKEGTRYLTLKAR